MVNTFEILIAFSSSESEGNASKGEINDCKRHRRDECSKSMKMKGSESVSREFC